MFQGRIQDLKKKKRFTGLQNFGACLRGMCPLRSEEKLQFSKSIRTIWCILFAWGAHTKSGALSLQKIEGACAGCAPLNLPTLCFYFFNSRSNGIFKKKNIFSKLLSLLQWNGSNTNSKSIYFLVKITEVSTNFPLWKMVHSTTHMMQD